MTKRVDNAVLFDLDGVLIDAVNIHRTAFDKALEEFHFPRDYSDEEFNGLPTRVKLERLNVPFDIQNKILNYKKELTLELMGKQLQPDPSKIELLKFLADNGFRLGCVTNSIRHTTIFALKKVELYQYLDVIVSNTDVRMPKPNPEPYVEAMRFLGIKTGVAVEDNEKGVQSAVGAGLRVVQVAGPEEVNLSLLDRIINESSSVL